MEMSSQDEEMPLPISSTYGHGQIIHHDPIPQLQLQNPIVPISVSQAPINEDHVAVPYKKMVTYKECLKNHAASIGGNATDGCGEFMPSGEEGSLEALTCSACHCHRNFHRKEPEDETKHPMSSYECYQRKLMLGHHFGTPGFVPPRAAQPHQMIMSSYNMMMGSTLASESDEQEDGGGNNVHAGYGYGGRPAHLVKKRFRTKFSPEQKEKMLNFAEKVGWKIQKQEESMVQQFCQEVGIKRRVLKVWMHNNKHNLAKKNLTTSSTEPPTVQIQIQD